MHGLGPIERETDEPYFHNEWEARVFGLFFANFAAGHYNVDMFRHAIERMAPAEYLNTSYYEHWLHAHETLLSEKGIITIEELDRKQAEMSKAGDA
jgi:nitrile hydratase